MSTPGNPQLALEPRIAFCGTVKSLKEARAVLSTSRLIFMDCEGVELGVRDGSLSILSLGTIPRDDPQTLLIYLIDVATLSDARLRPTFDLLAKGNITKVVWDGRMDYSALYHDFGVQMRNVIDLQIVDVFSRESRDTPEEHLQRFRGYVNAGLLERAEAKRRYARLHRISSLLQAVKEHQPVGYEQFTKVQVDHNMWENVRPLPAEYIKYAAMDIEMIAALYGVLCSRQYITPRNIPSLSTKSARYVAFWAERQPSTTHRGNHFIGNAFLPLELVDDISDTVASVPDHHKRQCSRCKRMFTAASVSSPPAKPSRRSQSTCWVCCAVAENSKHWFLRDRAIERRKAEAAAKASSSESAALTLRMGVLTIAEEPGPSASRPKYGRRA